MLAELEERAVGAGRAASDAAIALAAASDAADDGDELARMRLPVLVDTAAAADDRLAAAIDRLQAARVLEGSVRDGLTGAWRRETGLARAAAELERTQREQRPFVLAFVDLDGLKAINDEKGHLVGDRALRAVGATLLETLREDDVVVRFGGDEFVCALPGLVPTDAQVRFASVVCVLDDRWPGVSISVGIAAAGPGVALDTLLERADRDMYAQRRARAEPGVRR